MIKFCVHFSIEGWLILENCIWKDGDVWKVGCCCPQLNTVFPQRANPQGPSTWMRRVWFRLPPLGVSRTASSAGPVRSLLRGRGHRPWVVHRMGPQFDLNSWQCSESCKNVLISDLLLAQDPRPSMLLRDAAISTPLWTQDFPLSVSFLLLWHGASHPVGWHRRGSGVPRILAVDRARTPLLAELHGGQGTLSGRHVTWATGRM